MNKQNDSKQGRCFPQTRRRFFKTAGGAALGAAFIGALPNRNVGGTKPLVKVGLIGCGGRGTGAARDCLEAAKVLNVDLRFNGMADVFEDRLSRSRDSLNALGISVPESRCFLGFDAYQNVMASDSDIVILATPPNFRPKHFQAAVAARKHVFMEKPVAVDPVGCRAIMESGRAAAKANLSVVAGTQRRHELNYRAVAKAVSEGVVGKILGGTIHFCLGGGGIGLKTGRIPDWEWMIRRWGGWCELSGDHIVEQHVHSIDVMNWFLGSHPVSCVSFGERARRNGGNMYDFFSTDYEFPDGVHIHSMCRQIPGCWDRIGQFFRGEDGIVDLTGLVAADRFYVGGADLNSKVSIPKLEGNKNSYTQEHVNLLESVLQGKAINEAQNIAESTMAAIMGRISAYTGQMVTWEQMMTSDFTCTPSAADFENGSVKMPPEYAPIPGGLS